MAEFVIHSGTFGLFLGFLSSSAASPMAILTCWPSSRKPPVRSAHLPFSSPPDSPPGPLFWFFLVIFGYFGYFWLFLVILVIFGFFCFITSNLCLYCTSEVLPFVLCTLHNFLKCNPF